MKTIKLVAFVLVFFIFSKQAFSQNNSENNTAQKDMYEMSIEELLNMDISVVSTKGDKIFTSPSTVAVISNEEISKYNFLNIEEAISTIAGIKIYRTYIKRNLPTSRGVLQDHYANKVLVLINGVASWNAVTGEGNIDRININDVERIEVLKGPASVLYGTNAYSGAINIVLKKEESSKISILGGYGTNNSYETGLRASFVKNKIFTSVSVYSNDNIGPKLNFTDEKLVTKKIADHLKSENITINSSYKVNSLLFNIYRNYESYYGITPIFSTGGVGVDHKIDGYFINYTFNKDFSDKFNLKAAITYDYGYRNAARDDINSVKANIEGSRINTNIKSNYNFNEMISVEAGGDYELRNCKEYSNYKVSNDSVIDNNSMNNLDLTEYSLYSQLHFTKKKFSAIAGLRFTQNELFGTNFSPRASFVYSLNDKNSIKLMYGQSFRAPSFFEYYFYNTKTLTVFGNKNLKPETSKSIELAYLFSFDKFFVQALVYHGIYENKIYRAKDTTIVLSDGKTLLQYPGATVYTNGKTFTADGFELEVDYANPKLINGFFNYSFTKGDKGDKSTIKVGNNNIDVYNFLFVPQHTLSLGLNKTLFNKITLSSIYNYMSDSKGAFASLPAYQMLDFNVCFKHVISKLSISHTLSAKNIFDEHILIPEYTRIKVLNAIPYGSYRYIGYTLKINI